MEGGREGLQLGGVRSAEWDQRRHQALQPCNLQPCTLQPCTLQPALQPCTLQPALQPCTLQPGGGFVRRLLGQRLVRHLQLEEHAWLGLGLGLGLGFGQQPEP